MQLSWSLLKAQLIYREGLHLKFFILPMSSDLTFASEIKLRTLDFKDYFVRSL